MPLYTSKVLDGIGYPFIDGDRIWAIKDNKICYSDDYGDGWIEWVNLSPSWGPKPILYRDKQGNCYYDSGGKMYRVDSQTKAIQAVITYAVAEAHIGVTDAELPHRNQWNMTEDDEGNLYVGQYGLVPKSGGGLAICAYLWKSPIGGTSFTRIDRFVNDGTNNIHIHNIKCNPYNNKIYVTIGDNSKQCWVSSDKCSTFTQIPSAGGYTGFTFTQDAIYTADDLAADNNYIRKIINDGVPVAVMANPATYNTQTYYLIAVGENEMWVSNHNENNLPNKKTGVHKLTRNQDNTWTWTTILSADGITSDYVTISSNGRAKIPESNPYVYVEYCTTWTNLSIIRIRRVDFQRLKIGMADGKVITRPAFDYSQDGQALKGQTNDDVKYFKLVDVTDINATGLRIRTALGTKSIADS